MAKKWSIGSIKFPRNRPKNHAIIFARNLGINEIADPELYYYAVKWYAETNPNDDEPFSNYQQFEDDSMEGDFGDVHEKVLKEVEAYQKEEKKNKKPQRSKRPPKAPTNQKKPTPRQRIRTVAKSPSQDDDDDCCEELSNKLDEVEVKLNDKIVKLEKVLDYAFEEIDKQSRQAPTRTRSAASARTFVRGRRVTIGGGTSRRSQSSAGGNQPPIRPRGRIVTTGGSRNNPIVQILLKIQKSVDNILESLTRQQATTTRTIRTQRVTQEQRKRQEAESALEKSGKKTFESFQKVMSPVKGILDKIFDFIFYTLLGKAFTELIKWASDPKNKDKIESLKRFFKDWWPALLGTFILFGTRFGKFIRSTVGLAINLGKYIRAIGIPGLLKLLKNFAKGSLYTGLAVGAAYGAYQLIKPKEEEKNFTKIKPEVQKKEQEPKIKPLIMPPSAAFSNGGMIKRLNPGQQEAIRLDQIASDGSQQITSDSGLKITGAGPDTQLVAARPGEVVLTPEDAKTIKGKTGFDVYQFVSGRRQKFANNIQLAKDGGVIGPKLSAADYNSLLAISALEDITPQGRADVAQSIYNRLQASNKYGANFNQSKNTVKDIILATEQYQPIFNNIKDWQNITDRKSAAVAVMNSTKGKEQGWNMKVALGEILNAEKALKNPNLQQQAQQFVGTRTSFYGVKEQKNMKPEKGDVLRNPHANFFVHQGNYGTKPAPIPIQLQSPPKPKPKPKPKGFFEKAVNTLLQFTGVKKSDATLAPTTPNIRQPGPRVARQGTVTFTELPPMTMASRSMPATPSSGTQVPTISAKSPNYMEREYTLRAYGLA
jgi:hypothetical protein